MLKNSINKRNANIKVMIPNSKCFKFIFLEKNIVTKKETTKKSKFWNFIKNKKER